MLFSSEDPRKVALEAHNDLAVLPRMVAGQVWRVWVYDKTLNWGQLPPEWYFILLAPRDREVPGEYTLMRSHLRFGRVARVQLSGASMAFTALRNPRTSRGHTNWSGNILHNQSRPFIFAPEPVSWAPWEA